MEMIEWAATRHKREQIRQQQLEQQQAQALEQQRLQAQQAGIPGGNMQQPQPTAVPAVSKPPLLVGLVTSHVGMQCLFADAKSSFFGAYSNSFPAGHADVHR